MRSLLFPALSALAILVLAGCENLSLLEGKTVDYKSASTTAKAKAPTLDVPPDLVAPGTENRYAIPDNSGETAANFSDFARNNGSAGPGGNLVPVLPETPRVRLERNDKQRWLVVQDKPENVWPQLRSFWEENGFSIVLDNPQAGVMDTDWAENRAKIPKGGIQKVIGKVFGRMYSTNQMDMYHTRLERTRDGVTEIHVTQYGKEEMLTADKSMFRWQSRPNDPELEATMLQMLMVKLGSGETQAQAAPALAQNSAASPAAAVAVAAPAVSATPAKLPTRADDNKTLLLSEPFDRSWRKVGLALARSKLVVVDDTDRAGGLYYVHSTAAAKALVSDNAKADAAGRYLVSVQESGSGSIVGVTNTKGESTPITQKITDALFTTLGK
ncbi:MAG: outer membrane protein assembly factor BamC [Pseudomonadota bacterium]